jgi:exopolysaccharide biosynthesis polyprenyl glycosylphosphotransferase
MSRKRLPVWRTLLVIVTDIVAISVGLSFSYLVRFHSAFTDWFPVINGYDPEHYKDIFPWAVLIWFVALRFENLYRRRSRALDFNVLRRILTGSALAILVLIALTFFGKSGAFSRIFTVLMAFHVVLALLINRIALHYFFQWLMLHRGVGQTRTALLGSGPIVDQIIGVMRTHPERGMRPIGVIEGMQRVGAGQIAGVPVIGRVEELERVLTEHRIDEVILVDPGLERGHLIEALVQCERAMCVFRIVPEATELLVSGMVVETMDGIPMLGLRETPLQGWNAALKRMVDFCAAGAGLALTAPLVLLLAGIIRLVDGAPAFYRQERMGIDGRLFKIVKLRTMRVDAETDTGPTFASDMDPRCTRLGTALRKTHLDELPQLYNVLMGDMSLVGPRPERPHFIERFRDDVPQYMARHRVRAGITGWAQVNGLCGLHGSIPERLKYDMYYIENWSLWLDFKIMFLTLFGRIKPGPAS